MSAIEKAKKLVEDAYYDEAGMKDILRQDALIWATIAVAEQLQFAVARMGAYPAVEKLEGLDVRIQALEDAELSDYDCAMIVERGSSR